MITDVGVDLDGVLYDFAGAFHSYCERTLGRELPAPTKWDFYHEWGLSDEQFQKMLRDATTDFRIFMVNKPMEGAISGWQSLLDQGINIHILTHRHPDAYLQTIDWLTLHDLLPHGLHFGQNKTILKILAKDECAAIDDHYYYYKEYVDADIIAFMCDQPWNSAAIGQRVNNLYEFAERVRIYNEYHTHFVKFKKTLNLQPPKFSITQPKYVITKEKKPFNPHEAAKTTRWYNWTNQTTEN